MDHPGVVTSLDRANNGACETSRFGFGVCPPFNNAVKKLPALAKFHDQVDHGGILVGAFDGHDVGMAREMVHDFDLAAHVLKGLFGDKLALWNALACVFEVGGIIRAKVGGAKMALAKLAAQRVEVCEVFALVL